MLLSFHSSGEDQRRTVSDSLEFGDYLMSLIEHVIEHVIEHALLAKAWVIATSESLYRDYPVQVAFAVTAVCVLFLVAFARCLSRASRRSSLAQRAAKKRKERDSVVHGDAVRVRQTIERLGITPAQRCVQRIVLPCRNR